MFYVFNKSKIYSYMVALCTVVILFMAAGVINNMGTSSNSIETGTNIVSLNEVKTNEIMTNTIYINSIETGEIKNAIVNE